MAEIEVVPVPPIARVLPERLVVEALPVEREPEVRALVTVSAENVGVDAVVKFWPVLKASWVSPIESPTISIVRPPPIMYCPAVTLICEEPETVPVAVAYVAPLLAATTPVSEPSVIESIVREPATREPMVALLALRLVVDARPET